MLRYKLRTLLILLAILPPLLWLGWTKYEAWRAEQVRQAERNRMRSDLRRATLLLLSGPRRPRAKTDSGLPERPLIEVPRISPVPHTVDRPADAGPDQSSLSVPK